MSAVFLYIKNGIILEGNKKSAAHLALHPMVTDLQPTYSASAKRQITNEAQWAAREPLAVIFIKRNKSRFNNFHGYAMFLCKPFGIVKAKESVDEGKREDVDLFVSIRSRILDAFFGD